MRKLLTLVAAAALTTACHNRSEEEVGAAPDQGDTTAVTHAIDSTRTGPPGVAGRPGDATVTPDSVGVDSAAVQDTTAAVDTTMADTSLTSTPQDTLGPGHGALDSTFVNDSAAVQSDTAGTNKY